jgi:tRNA(fMet)-specific endonuclease VapC
LFELGYGHAGSARRAESGRQLELFFARGVYVAAFYAEDAAHAGEIRAHLEARGMPISAYDIPIAAPARRGGATLVTSNMREFARVPGLLVADWAV